MPGFDLGFGKHREFFWFPGIIFGGPWTVGWARGGPLKYDTPRLRDTVRSQSARIWARGIKAAPWEPRGLRRDLAGISLRRPPGRGSVHRRAWTHPPPPPPPRRRARTPSGIPLGVGLDSRHSAPPQTPAAGGGPAGFPACRDVLGSCCRSGISLSLPNARNLGWKTGAGGFALAGAHPCRGMRRWRCPGEGGCPWDRVGMARDCVGLHWDCVGLCGMAWDCTGIGWEWCGIVWKCTGIGWDRTGITSELHGIARDCAGIALGSHGNCTGLALGFNGITWDCTGIVWDCGIALGSYGI